MFLIELIDIWNINRYICKVLQNARIITLLRLLWKLFPLELGKNVVFSWIFQQKISANRLAVVGMAGRRAGGWAGRVHN